MQTEFVYRWDGALTNFCRHDTINGRRGQGGLVVYEGEAKEVVELLLKHSKSESTGE